MKWIEKVFLIKINGKKYNNLVKSRKMLDGLYLVLVDGA
jgi:hypothetical protein